MPVVCGVKRKRSLEDISLEEDIDLEQQEKCLYDLSLTKLRQEQMQQGTESKLLKSVLINNALRILHCHRSFIEDEIFSGACSDITPNFLANTFGPNGYLSVPLSPCPSNLSAKAVKEDFDSNSLLNSTAGVVLDSIAGMESSDSDSAVACSIEMPVESASVNGQPLTGTSPSNENHFSIVTSEAFHDIGKLKMYSEPISDDSGLGESMDSPLCFLADLHNVDISLYDYDQFQPDLACLSSEDLIESSCSVKSFDESPSHCSPLCYTSTKTTLSIDVSCRNANSPSPLASVYHRPVKHCAISAEHDYFNDTDRIVGLLVDS